MRQFTAVQINETGCDRVLDGKPGMVFIVDAFTNGARGPIAHVRDYRYANDSKPFQIWSIGADGYEVVS